MLSFPIFQKLGGEEKAVILLQQRRAFSRHALHKWKTFRRLPTWAQLALTQEAVRRRVSVSPDDFEARDAS